MSANGLGICDGAVIAFRQPSFALKLNRITEAEHLMSSRTIANTLLAVRCFAFNYFSLIISTSSGTINKISQPISVLTACLKFAGVYR